MISSTASGSGPGPALKLETRLAGVSSDVTGITMDPPLGISGAIRDPGRMDAPIDAFRLADERPRRRGFSAVCVVSDYWVGLFSAPKPCEALHSLQKVAGSVLSMRCRTGFSVFRYAKMAYRSSSVRLRYSAHGMIWLSGRALTKPVRSAWVNSASS